ncbi:MAG: UvrD-helicase domain-containing protein, partial [Alphaproteobacteria bacterium]|nr:UvrD-helicase domain-containing protein [Alphaproteobacteria bacterium]
MTAAVVEADRAQRAALDPTASVWVSASAGTGKTKVLTERLLTLMLNGTEPARILCLTFTRAAAAEMANRLNERLARWTVMPRGQLEQELVSLTGRFPGETDIASARRLFAKVLDAPGGAKIDTIHAFCQSLLRRFPLEAGAPPDFAVVDERSATEALSDAAADVIAVARRRPDSELAQALAIVARYLTDERFRELMAGLARERSRLAAALHDGEAAFIGRVAAALGVAADATETSLAAAFAAGGDLAALRSVCAALADGTDKTDQPRSRLIARWCEGGPAERIELIDPYVSVFLTAMGEIRARLFTKGAAVASDCDLSGVLMAEAARVKRFCETRNGVVILEATRAIVRLGCALVEAYQTRKRRHAQLDYDDLVLGALDLLRKDGIAPWVLFKLDGGLDHILIDEAQDTNPEQWQIVTLLAEEFFAGEDPLGRMRTVFAVGDSKQSIYGFQRADPLAFGRMRVHFERRVSDADQRWRTVPLEISFRAAEPLLRAVDAVFAMPAAADGVGLDGAAIRHVAARVGQAGVVEWWPEAPPPPEEPDDPGTAALRRAANAHTRLARAVAATIDGWLRDGERLASRDRPVRAGDIMVLVRRRNAFVDDLLRELKQRRVPVAGADRLILSEQLAVKDLVALGQFLLLPEDDLTLAAVLKGPIFGVSEEQLFTLAYDRGSRSLWSRLLTRGADDLLLRDAASTLRALLARADFAPPYEL